MTDKPNCSTCAFATLYKQEPEFASCSIVGHIVVIKDIIKHGCISHPQAREYLMAPVITELEQISLPDNPFHDDEGFEYGIKKAIALIKGEK